MPEAKIAILAEGFVVERGKLANSRAPGKSLQPSPASVLPLTDSRVKWGLTDK